MHVITVGAGQSLSIIKFWTLDYFVTQFNVEENDCEVEIMNTFAWLGCPRKRDSSAASHHFFLPFPQQKPESDHTSLVVLTLLSPPHPPHPLSSYWGLKGREATLSTRSCPADHWLVRCCRSWQHVTCQIIHLFFFFFFLLPWADWCSQHMAVMHVSPRANLRLPMDRGALWRTVIPLLWS